MVVRARFIFAVGRAGDPLLGCVGRFQGKSKDYCFGTERY